MKRKELGSDLKFSVCIPTYNGAKWIKKTLQSILNQSYKNMEIIVVDDASTDKTVEIIKSFKDKRIKVFKNAKNLGYPLNMEECRKRADGDILFPMGQDDILCKDAILKVYNAFKISDDIGAVTRPFFWFEKNLKKPLRVKWPLDPDKDVVVRIMDDFKTVRHVFNSLDQVSALAYRRKYMDLPFHKDIFPCHVYPFASIFKKHPIVHLKDYILAVRIESSQTRSLSNIYDKSPMKSWREMFESVLKEKKFEEVKKFMIKDFVGLNSLGLFQIRSYGRYRYFIREVYYLLTYRPENVFRRNFWIILFMCLFLPSLWLRRLVDWYKKEIYSKQFEFIKFDPAL